MSTAHATPAIQNDKLFLYSGIVAIVSLTISYAWSGMHGLLVCAVLAVMEVSLSFDNAIVNATVLRQLPPMWQKRFLSWGLLVTVFGMYYLFPIIIVTLATGANLFSTIYLAFYDYPSYTNHIVDAHAWIASFGGMFLLMVFLDFMFDEKRQLHWVGSVERRLARFGRWESLEAVIALLLLLVIQPYLSVYDRLHSLPAGVAGVVLYTAIRGMADFFGMRHTHISAGLAGFIYLNILDASFSIDAVVGAFAVSQDIVIILMGLTTGAMFMRSITLFLVNKGTLERYVFLEHGAHYGLGALAIFMLASLFIHIPDLVTGLVGLVFIALSLLSSVKRRKS